MRLVLERFGLNGASTVRTVQSQGAFHPGVLHGWIDGEPPHRFQNSTIPPQQEELISVRDGIVRPRGSSRVAEEGQPRARTSLQSASSRSLGEGGNRRIHW